MDDIARLGLAIDSSQARSAATDLKGFAAAANTAEQASARLSQAAQSSGERLGYIDAMAKRAGVSYDEMKARVDANLQAHQKLDTASQSAVRALDNLSKGSKQAANDNANLEKATNSSTSALDKFVTRFSRGLIAGFVTAGVQQLVQFLTQLNAQLAATADTAQRVGIGGQQYQGLATAASYRGIGNSDFNSAMMSLNAQIDLAKHGLGDLSSLFKADGKSVGDTASTFSTLADLVARAGSDAQKFSLLQQAGIPATTAMVRLFEQGGAAIGKQADAARKLTDQQLADAKRLDDEWNRVWTDFSNWGKGAVVNVGTVLKNLSMSEDVKAFIEWSKTPVGMAVLAGGAGAVLGGSVAGPMGAVVGGATLGTLGFARGAQYQNAVRPNPDGRAQVIITGGDTFSASGALGGKSATKADATVDNATVKLQLQNQIQQLNLYGQLQTAEEARAAVLKQMELAGRSNLSVDQARANKLAELAYETNLGITAMKSSSDAMRVEADTIGMSAGQAAAYSAAQNVLNEKKRLGINISDEQRAAILREADSLGQAAQRLDSMRFGYDTFNGTFLSFNQNLRNGQGFWESWGNAGASALGKIADKLMTMATDGLWKAAFGGSSSSLGGLFGSLFGSSSAELPGWGTSAFVGPTFAAADGGNFGPGWGVVGERGPELINVHSRGVTVIPNEISKPFLPGFAEGGMLSAGGNVTRLPFGQNNSPMVFNYSPTIDARGADAQAVARLAQAFTEDKKNFERNVQAVVTKTSRNQPGFGK